jgi:hypothetical protein
VKIVTGEGFHLPFFMKVFVSVDAKTFWFFRYGLVQRRLGSLRGLFAQGGAYEAQQDPRPFG